MVYRSVLAGNVSVLVQEGSSAPSVDVRVNAPLMLVLVLTAQSEKAK
jgi:hypothetical protein